MPQRQYGIVEFAEYLGIFLGKGGAFSARWMFFVQGG